MRVLTNHEIDCVAGGDNPGLGPYNQGAFFSFHPSEDPATSYVSVGWDDRSALLTLTMVDIGLTAAMPGGGLWGAVSKQAGKAITGKATDSGYTGSLMGMEGFSLLPGGGMLRIMQPDIAAT